MTTQGEAEKAQAFLIRPLEQADQWVRCLLIERWGSTMVVTRGQVHAADELPGFAALRGSKPVGLVTYRVRDGETEVVSLDSLAEDKGVGSMLLEAVLDEARARGVRRAIVTTTNDNLRALRFYQKRGFTLRALRAGALERTRELKPSISALGQNGIPLRDELELVLDDMGS